MLKRCIASVGFVLVMAPGAVAADDLEAARTALYERRLEDASRLLDKTIEQAPSSDDARLLREQVFQLRHDYEKALDDISVLLRHDPNSAVAYAERALAEARLNKRKEALADTEKALRLNDKCARAFVARAFLYEDEWQSQKALDAATRAVELDPNDYLCFAARCVANNQREDWSAILEDVHQAKMIAPYEPWLYLFESNSLMRLSLRKPLTKNEEWRSPALESVNKGIELATKENDRVRLGMLYFQRAKMKNFWMPLDETIEDDLNESLKYIPNDSRVYAIFADYYSQCGNLEAALQKANEAIALAPNQSFPFLTRAACHERAAQMSRSESKIKDRLHFEVSSKEQTFAHEQYELAIRDYTTALSMTDSSPLSLIARSLAECEISDWSAALKDISEYIRSKPDDARGYWFRSYFRKETHDAQGAAEDEAMAKKLEAAK